VVFGVQQDHGQRAAPERFERLAVPVAPPGVEEEPARLVAGWAEHAYAS
jgi:hypothetical protein